jgi:hypothetical protein
MMLRSAVRNVSARVGMVAIPATNLSPCARCRHFLKSMAGVHWRCIESNIRNARLRQLGVARDGDRSFLNLSASRAIVRRSRRVEMNGRLRGGLGSVPAPSP